MIRLIASATLLVALTGCVNPNRGDAVSPYASLQKIGEVDARFQSYNVEMVEVTGGRFWAPYGGPAGETYRMRGPLDLADPRLRALARHLSPAYMRVSGTWANTTYLPAEGEVVSAPPEGYKQVLTRDQWREVVSFAKATDAKIVTSFAVGPGTRGPDGVWRTEQAQRLVDLTRASGGTLAAAEFFNEPNAAFMGGLPKEYGTADYVRDFRIFRDWAKRSMPGMKLVGPGGVGESSIADGIPVALQGRDMILSKDVLAQNPRKLDILSYHFYATVSQRCINTSRKPAELGDALKPQWLDATLKDYGYYAALRDQYEPGAPIWVTETAQSACGGSPWAASFIDSFRYVNQLGLLAQKSVNVVFHNTLSASDYALIDGDTLTPRPNYWAAVLWNRLMGTTVLASPPSSSTTLRLYAQCLKGHRGGVALAAINIGDDSATLDLGANARAWIMRAEPLTSTSVTINGIVPSIDKDGTLVGLEGVKSGTRQTVGGKSIAFFALPAASNVACK